MASRSPRPSLCRLPSECLSMIFSHLCYSSNSAGEIVPVLLTCRLFNAVASPVFYESIHIDDHEKLSLLFRSVLTSPPISQIMKSLTVEILPFTVWWDLQFSQKMFKLLVETCCNLREIHHFRGLNPNILEKIEKWKNVENLREITWMRIFTDRVKITPESLRSLFLIPNLETLVLGGLPKLKTSFVPPISSTNIKFLTFQGIEPLWNLSDWELLGQILRLKTLDVGGPWALFNTPSLLNKFLKDQSEELESLTLRRSNLYYSLPNQFILDNVISDLRCLKSLSIDFHMISPDCLLTKLPGVLEYLRLCVVGIESSELAESVENARGIKKVTLWRWRKLTWSDEDLDELVERMEELEVELEIDEEDDLLYRPPRVIYEEDDMQFRRFRALIL